MAVMEATAMPGEQTLNVTAMTYRLTIKGSGDLDITDALFVSIGQNDTPFTIDASGLGDRRSTSLALLPVRSRFSF
jgi:hypothetical protein